MPRLAVTCLSGRTARTEAARSRTFAADALWITSGIASRKSALPRPAIWHLQQGLTMSTVASRRRLSVRTELLCWRPARMCTVITAMTQLFARVGVPSAPKLLCTAQRLVAGPPCLRLPSLVCDRTLRT